MKILAVGDLHNRREWFAWVSAQTARFNLIALPGDLLDIFQKDLPVQKVFVQEWLSKEAEKGTPIAWCSGNHDITRWSATSSFPQNDSCWTDQLRFPSVVGDLETKAFLANSGERFLVSCIPHCELSTDAWEEAIEHLLSEGWKERSRLDQCSWIVLAHNPPIHTPVAATPSDSGGSDRVRAWVEQFQPDYLLSGHLHEAPDLGGYRAELGQCLCINPGRVEQGDFPSHVTIDTTTRKTSFHRGSPFSREGPIPGTSPRA